MTIQTFMKAYGKSYLFGLLSTAIVVVLQALRTHLLANRDYQISEFALIFLICAIFLAIGDLILALPSFFLVQWISKSSGSWLLYPICGLVVSILFSLLALVLLDARRMPLPLTSEYLIGSMQLLLPGFVAGAVQGHILGQFVNRSNWL